MDEVKDNIQVLTEYVVSVQVDKIIEIRSDEFRKELEEVVKWMKDEGYEITSEAALIGWSAIETLYYARTRLKEILEWKSERQKMYDSLEGRF